MRIRKIFEGAGATLLLLYPHLKTALSPYHLDIYHRMSPMNTVYAALLIWLLLVWAVCWGIDTLLVRFDPETHHLVWCVVMALLAYQTLVALPTPDDLRSFSDMLVEEIHSSHHAVMAGAAVALLLLLIRFLSLHVYQKTVRGMRIVLAGIGICILWMIPKLAYLSAHTPALGVTSFNHAVAAEHMPKRRIVWILMDELSYRLAIEAPPADLPLQNFAELRGQSYEFTQVHGSSPWTDIVVPGVLAHENYDRIHSDADGNLYVHSAEKGWQRFDEYKSIFADAKQAGWTTGVSGYYNPYCRILPDVLDRCTWTRENPFLAHMSPTWSVLKNTLMPLRRFGAPLRPGDRGPNQAENLFILPTQVADARKMIEDPRLGLLFIHLAIPHPPGQNIRLEGHSRIGTYKENLKLADALLGELRQKIEAEPLGPQTTILLTSDHSWRTWHWRGSSFWSAEDEAFSQEKGNYDERPVLLVHLPGETENHRFDHPANEIIEHELIESMMRQPSFGDAEMRSFLQAH